MFEIVTEIDAELVHITEADLARAMRGIGKVKRGQTVLGRVESENLRKLFALTRRYQALEDKAKHSAMFDADTPEQEAEHLRAASKCCSLHKLCNTIFWNEVKNQLDRDGSAWSATSLGLRDNWCIVTRGTVDVHKILRPEPETLTGRMGEILSQFLNRDRDAEGDEDNDDN